MNKKQKIWLGVFLGMFIVPEILWSPVTNVVYGLIQNSNHVKSFRSNFLTNSDYNVFLILFLFIQFIGLIGTFILIKKNNLTYRYKLFLILIILILLIITGFSFFTVFSLSHGIGF